MLRLPSSTDKKARGVGIQVWKSEEMRVRNAYSGVQCLGSEADQMSEDAQNVYIVG